MHRAGIRLACVLLVFVLSPACRASQDEVQAETLEAASSTDPEVRISDCLLHAEEVVLTAANQESPDPIHFDAALFRQAMSRGKPVPVLKLMWEIRAKHIRAFTVRGADGAICTIRTPYTDCYIDAVGEPYCIQLDERDLFEFHLELKRIRELADHGVTWGEWRSERRLSDEINSAIRAAQAALSQGDADAAIALLSPDFAWHLASGAAGTRSEAESWLRTQAGTRGQEKFDLYITSIDQFYPELVYLLVDGEEDFQGGREFVSGWIRSLDGRLQLAGLDEWTDNSESVPIQERIMSDAGAKAGLPPSRR